MQDDVQGGSPETRAQQVQKMYCRLALYALSCESIPYANLKIPTRYFATVMQEIRGVYPGILTYIVEWYGGHSHVIMWHPTAKPVAPDLPLSTETETDLELV